MDSGIERFQKISQCDNNQNEYHTRNIGQIDHLYMQEKGHIAHQRTELFKHCHIPIAWEGKCIDDRDNVCQIEVTLMHLWQEKWHYQRENERELEHDHWCDLFAAHQCQDSHDDDYHDR